MGGPYSRKGRGYRENVRLKITILWNSKFVVNSVCFSRFLGDLTSSVMANLTKSNALVDEVSNDTDAHNQSNVDTG